MTGKWVGYFLLLFSPNLWAGDILFPVAKNGKWGLVSQSGARILEATYDYLEYDRAGNKFIYYQAGKMGVISSQGEILTGPVHENLFFLDTLWFAVSKNQQWALQKNTERITEFIYDSIVSNDRKIVQLFRGDSSLFFQRNSAVFSERFYVQKPLPLAGTFIATRHNNTFDILAEKDLHVLVTDIISLNLTQDKLLLITTPLGQRLYDAEKEAYQTTYFNQIREVKYGYFTGTKNGKVYLFESDKPENLLEIPEYDAIVQISLPWVLFTRYGSTGVWNVSSGEEVVPPNYEAISLGGGYFHVRKNGFYGVISKSGKLLVPAEYESVEVYDNFFLVEKSGYYGLISKNGNQIKPCEFVSVRAYEKNVKCFRQKGLTVLNIDDAGTIQGETSYTEYMSIGFDREKLPQQRSRELNFSGDPSETRKEGSAQLGWFQEEYERMIKDSLQIVKGKWGLKNDLDSVVIRPRFADIWIRSRTPYTQCYQHKMWQAGIKEELQQLFAAHEVFILSPGSYGVSYGAFRLVNHVDKKLLSQEKFLSINYADFSMYKLARAVTDCPVLINQNGDVIFDSITYYGNYQENHLPVCFGGTYRFSKSWGSTSPGSTWSFLLNLGFNDLNVGRGEDYLSVDHGRWHFLNTRGELINETPFDYVNPFHHNRAIVKRGNKWGVVDTSMQEIVPIEYNYVKEFYVDGKQIFVVSRGAGNRYLYRRSSGEITKTDLTEVVHFHQGTWFVKNRMNTYALADTNLHYLTESRFQAVTPFEDGYAMVTSRGKRSVLDEQGNEYLQGYKAKDINYLGFGRFEIVQNKGILVTTIHGDTVLLPKDCREIIRTNERYIFYKNSAKELQIYTDGTPPKLPSKTRIESFCFENETVLLSKENERRIYSLKTQKFLNKWTPGILSLGPDCYTFMDSHQKVGLMNLAGDTLIAPSYMSIEFQQKNWLFAQVDKHKWVMLSLKGKAMNDFVFTRWSRKKDHYILYTTEGIGLYTLDGEELLPCIYDHIEKYNDTFYKTTRDDEHDLFYLDGKKVIPGYYSDYKGFSTSSMVVRHNHQDYLYTGYLNKTLSFQNVIPVNSDLFILSESVHQGVYNDAGDTIVPIRYHQVTIDRNYLQVRFFNSFGYFSTSGEALFDPY